DDWPFTIDRLAQRVDDAAEELVANRNRNDPAGALDRVAFLDLFELAEQHCANALLFEIQRDAVHAVRELEHLARHRVFDAVHTGNAIPNRNDAPDLRHVDVDRVAADLFPDDLGDFLSLYVHFLVSRWAPPPLADALGPWPSRITERAARRFPPASVSSFPAAASRFRRRRCCRCAPRVHR